MRVTTSYIKGFGCGGCVLSFLFSFKNINYLIAFYQNNIFDPISVPIKVDSINFRVCLINVHERFANIDNK